MMNMQDILKLSPVIPVMVIDDLADAVPLATALVNGGLKVLEITLRTPSAIEAVKLIKSSVPEAVVGTGTVIDMHTLNLSLAADVDFMVSPGISDTLIRAVRDQKINLLPGVSSASEAMNLLDEGITCQKFFPAEAAGGYNFLSSISGPLPQITFCPTGGISMSNASDYLNLPNVACVGGSWMLDKQLIKDKNWQQITDNCLEICSTLK